MYKKTKKTSRTNGFGRDKNLRSKTQKGNNTRFLTDSCFINPTMLFNFNNRNIMMKNNNNNTLYDVIN